MSRILDFSDGFESNVLPTVTGILASDITVTPAGTIAATTVQAALVELDSEKVAKIVSVDNTVPRFDGIAGAVQGSSVVIGDTNDVTGVVGLTASGTVSANLISGAAVKDEDNMISNSATHLATQQSIKAYVDAEVSSVGASPTGAVTMFGGAAAPTGWLLCDGAAVSRVTYSALFAVLSTTYGVGDGSTTFNLPDARGVFVRGAGSQTISAIGYTGTRGTTQGDQLQGHYHNIASANGGQVQYQQGGGATNERGPIVSADIVPANPYQAQAAIADGSNGTPRTGTETRPANITLSYIIKT